MGYKKIVIVNFGENFGSFSSCTGLVAALSVSKLTYNLNKNFSECMIYNIIQIILTEG